MKKVYSIGLMLLAFAFHANVLGMQRLQRLMKVAKPVVEMVENRQPLPTVSRQLMVVQPRAEDLQQMLEEKREQVAKLERQKLELRKNIFAQESKKYQAHSDLLRVQLANGVDTQRLALVGKGFIMTSLAESLGMYCEVSGPVLGVMACLGAAYTCRHGWFAARAEKRFKGELESNRAELKEARAKLNKSNKEIKDIKKEIKALRTQL